MMGNENELRICPHSPEHRVYGGHPVYVCVECSTEWVVAKAKDRRGRFNVLYTHFNSEGKVLERWKKPLDENVLVSTSKRSLAG
jgi:hypothetical protein